MLCAGAAAQGRTRGLNFFVWNFAWDRLASRLYAATATTFLMKILLSTHCALWRHMTSETLVNINSGNGLSPVKQDVITWNNADLLWNALPGMNFSEISVKIQWLSFKKFPLKKSSAKCLPFCSGRNVFINKSDNSHYWQINTVMSMGGSKYNMTWMHTQWS